MANKVMSLHDAVEKYVHDNDVLCLGGFTTNRKPYAAVYEILRQGKTGFVGWSGPAGGDWDSLIGEGRVRAYINCYTANSGYTNVARRFRAAIEKGELTYEDYSQDVLMLQLHAASLGLPYLPVRMMQGSGLVKFWGISEEKRKTMEGVDNLKCVDIENPFEPGEKLLAVPVPKLDCAIIHVQQASPDGTCIIDGDEFHDVDIAIAAKRTIVTCEEIVSDEYIRRDPTKTRIFGECVNAVVRAPYGARPYCRQHRIKLPAFACLRMRSRCSMRFSDERRNGAVPPYSVLCKKMRVLRFPFIPIGTGASETVCKAADGRY